MVWQVLPVACTAGQAERAREHGRNELDARCQAERASTLLSQVFGRGQRRFFMNGSQAERKA